MRSSVASPRANHLDLAYARKRAVAQGWCESPVTVHLGGGDLVVAIDRAADGSLQATQTGEAQEICTVQLAGELVAALS